MFTRPDIFELIDSVIDKDGDTPRRYNVPLSSIPDFANCKRVKYCNGSCPGIAHQIRKTFLKSNGIESIDDIL